MTHSPHLIYLRLMVQRKLSQSPGLRRDVELDLEDPGMEVTTPCVKNHMLNCLIEGRVAGTWGLEVKATAVWRLLEKCREARAIRKTSLGAVG